MAIVYDNLIKEAAIAPPAWRAACTHVESTLHQLSPYIGKLKSAIAKDLVEEYSRPGELVADVFCGSGTVPLEAARLGRRIFAADASPYAITLTKGKVRPPESPEHAIAALNRALIASRDVVVDLRRVPRWVRDFFHPRTLKETIQLTIVLRQRRAHFLLACLLGITHHQRPGFLSYPSSHLVPYLRSRKFPRDEYPEMYAYRAVEPRIKAKVLRATKRYVPIDAKCVVDVRRSTIQSLKLPTVVDCFITSPPYMNALDYGRDNRLRNWFLSGSEQQQLDAQLKKDQGFQQVMKAYARSVTESLAVGGRCVLVVGEKSCREADRYPSEVLADIIDKHAPALSLKEIISDTIPDIRRARRHLTGVKKEHILIYERNRRSA